MTDTIFCMFPKNRCVESCLNSRAIFGDTQPPPLLSANLKFSQPVYLHCKILRRMPQKHILVFRDASKTHFSTSLTIVLQSLTEKKTQTLESRTLK